MYNFPFISYWGISFKNVFYTIYRRNGFATHKTELNYKMEKYL